MHIAIAGNIGSGKTTLTKMLAKHYRWDAHFEDVDDNPYLNDFYEEMQRWSFNLQIYFLNSRFNQMVDIQKSGKTVIQDRTIYEDAEIFATALHNMRNFTGRDWDTYWSFYQIILNAIRPPDLMIYLRCSMRTLRKRIRLRGRSMEKDIPLSYLKRLEKLYDQWLANYRLGEILVLETDKLDYINDMVDCLDVMERVEALLPATLKRPG